MAGATGFAIGHISHCHPLAATVLEGFGVAVIALVDAGMEIVAEISDYRASTVLECQVGRFITDMALVAIASGGECSFTIMAAAARLAFSHIGHRGLAGALTVVVLLCVAVVALVCLRMEIMAENSIIYRF